VGKKKKTKLVFHLKKGEEGMGDEKTSHPGRRKKKSESA